MTDIEKQKSATLESLAQQINEEHRQCETAFSSGLEHAIRAGELLEEAKGGLEHGKWLGWLKENFDGAVRTAQAYMRVARKKADFEELVGFDEGGKAQHVAHLSLRDTLSALTERSKEEFVEDARREIKQRQWTLAAEDVPTEEPVIRLKPDEAFDNAIKRINTKGREDVAKFKEQISTSWSDEERDLLKELQDGKTIVVNMHDKEGAPHRNLVPWLKDTGQLVKVARPSEWGNPFELGPDGDRDTVVANYEEHYLPYKPSLNPREELSGGKALGCWCAPLLCHGHVLARLANEA
jgi:hypothetical protein